MNQANSASALVRVPSLIPLERTHSLRPTKDNQSRLERAGSFKTQERWPKRKSPERKKAERKSETIKRNAVVVAAAIHCFVTQWGHYVIRGQDIRIMREQIAKDIATGEMPEETIDLNYMNNIIHKSGIVVAA